MPSTEIPRLYYSIGEVSEITGIDPHVLRYWETEFRELSPRKNQGGKRLYRDADIKLVLQIKNLLYEQRFTIEGARRWLKETPRSKWNDLSSNQNTVRDDVLYDIRQGLMDLKSILEDN